MAFLTAVVKKRLMNNMVLVLKVVFPARKHNEGYQHHFSRENNYTRLPIYLMTQGKYFRKTKLVNMECILNDYTILQCDVSLEADRRDESNDVLFAILPSSILK